MSRESLTVPAVLAAVCAAGAVALGMVADSKFEQAVPWEQLGDRAGAAIEAGDYAPPEENQNPLRTIPTQADLEYTKNTANGTAFGYNFWGWASVAGTVVLGACAADRGWKTFTLMGRRPEDEQPGSSAPPEE